MFESFAIPTPFQIGPVNAYLAGRTLVDPGPESEDAAAAVEEALASHDLVPGDVEQVVVTHPHPDHFGMAARFHEEGARVLASGPTADIVEDFEGHYEYERAYFRDLFERHGMDAGTARTVTELPGSYLSFAPSVSVDERLADGDRIEVDGQPVDVTVTTGHAPGESLFAFDHDGGRWAIVGDHVLPEITPNPLLQPPASEGEPRPRVLPAYNDSLDTLRERGFDRLLGGHRAAIEDPAARIEYIREAHEARTANVRDLVEEPKTAVEVMHGLFGDLPATEGFPGMSEALGHLDVLEDRGAVERRERDGELVYEGVER